MHAVVITFVPRLTSTDYRQLRDAFIRSFPSSTA